MVPIFRLGVGAILLIALTMTALAEPWTGGRGPWNRGIYPTVQFPKTPSVVWKAYLGKDMTSLPPTNTLVYGKAVIAGFGQMLIAFATDTGEGLWFSKLTDHKLAGDLLLLDDQIVVSYESGLVEGRNPGDGKVLWATKLTSGLRNGPTYDDNILYFTTKSKAIEAVERGTGAKIGQPLPAGGNIEAAPLSLGKSMLLSYSNGLVRRVEQGGIVRWTFQIPNSVVSLTPATDGRVVIINTPKTLVALHPFDRTNPVRWVHPLTSQLHEPATLDEDRLFIATYNNRILAIDLATGGDLWTAMADTTTGKSTKTEMGAPVPATPIGAPLVIGKQLLVRMDSGLIALLDKASGKLNWVYRLKAPDGAPAPTRGYYAGEPAVDGDHVYFAGSDGVMYHLSAGAPDVDPPTFDNLTPTITDKGFLDAKSLESVGVSVLDEGSGFSADQVSIKLDNYDLTPNKQYDAKTGLITAKLSSEMALAPGMHRLVFTAKDNRGNVGSRAESFIIGAADSPELIPVTITGEFLPKTLQVKPGSIICWTNRSGGTRTIVADGAENEKPAFTSDELFPDGLPNDEKWAWIVPADNDLIGSQFYYHCRLSGKAGDGKGFGTGLVGMISIVESLQTTTTTGPEGMLPQGGPAPGMVPPGGAVPPPPPPR